MKALRVVLGLAGVAVLLVYFLGSGHGTKLRFKQGELYYKPPVTEAQAEAVGAHLEAQGYFDDEAERSVQLLKEGEVFQIRFVVKPQAISGTEYDAGFLEVAAGIAREALAGAAVEVHLCDDALKSRRKLVPPGGG
ncbi:MAG: hypothetical protein ACT4PV_07530 [Planctomycetaceae bacterium]